MDLFLIFLIMFGGVALVVLELLAIPGTTIAGLCGVGLLGYGIYEVFISAIPIGARRVIETPLSPTLISFSITFTFESISWFKENFLQVFVLSE